VIGHPELEREVRQWIANNTDAGGCEGVTAELMEHLLGIVNGLELDVQDYQRRLRATNTAWIEQSRKLDAALGRAERVEKASQPLAEHCWRLKRFDDRDNETVHWRRCGNCAPCVLAAALGTTTETQS
jgi:hypothetical protein